MTHLLTRCVAYAALFPLLILHADFRYERYPYSSLP